MDLFNRRIKVTAERSRKKDWDSSTGDAEVDKMKREQEEQMVKAIIQRVKMECAMEGEDSGRKGYQKH